MCISHHQQDRFLVITFEEKRFGAALASEFENKVKLLINEGHTAIVLDLSNVGFLDSSGLGAIVSSFQALNGRGEFVLCGVHGAVASLFKLTRMDKIFKIYANLEEALKSQCE